MRSLLLDFLLGPIIRPCTRLLLGFVAIPAFRAMRRKVANQQAWDREFEKDIEQWFRASLLLFRGDRNFETWLAGILAVRFEHDLSKSWITAGRVLLAMGVIEAMPDQQLFSIIHPGPRPLKYDRRADPLAEHPDADRPLLQGGPVPAPQPRSPMLAILAVFFGGPVGWACYFLAITQYLIIGLVTSRDKAARRPLGVRPAGGPPAGDSHRGTGAIADGRRPWAACCDSVARERTGHPVPALTRLTIDRSAFRIELFRQPFGSDQPVGVPHEPGDFVPVDILVELDPEPSLGTDVGRGKVADRDRPGSSAPASPAGL